MHPRSNPWPNPRTLRARHGAAAALAAALALGTPNAAGEDGASDPASDDRASARYDESVTVLAERVPVPTAETGTSVTVLDRDEIERRHAPWLADLLETVPGVEVVRTGVDGKVATVFVRGGAGQHALVLIDGIRVNGATDAGFDLSSLRTDDVERIEVLRGPQSVLYGSEAMAGVIAITTRAGSGDRRLSGSIAAGSHDRFEGVLTVEGGAGPWALAVTGSALETDSVSAAAESAGNPETDPYDDVQLAVRAGRDLGDGGRLTATVRGVRATSRLDGFGVAGPADDPNFLQDRESLRTAIRWDVAPIGRVAPRLVVGASHDRYIGRDPDTTFHNYDIRNRIASVDAQADIALGAAGHVLVGAGYERRSGVNRGSFDETADLVSAFAQHRRSWNDRVHVAAGVRLEDHSEFGNETTWRAAAAWRATGAVRVHGSVATGFRAPSLNELYFPFLGVPTLDPERSTGADLGVETRWASDRVVLDVTAFRTEFDDLIQFDLGTFTFANVASARATGVEATFTATIGRGTDVRFGWTHQDTRDDLTGLALARRPRDKASLVLMFDAGRRLDVRVAALAVRDRIEADGTGLDDYERMDVAVEYDAGALRPFVRIDNLLDEDYEELPGYTVPGTTFVAGVRFGFAP